MASGIAGTELAETGGAGGARGNAERHLRAGLHRGRAKHIGESPLQTPGSGHRVSPGGEVGDPWVRGSARPPLLPGCVSRGAGAQKAAGRAEDGGGFYPKYKPTVKLIGNNSKKRNKNPNHRISRAQGELARGERFESAGELRHRGQLKCRKTSL